MAQGEVLKVGMLLEESFTVEPEHAADRVGSGGVPVLASPWMIAFMERVAFQLLEKQLPAGQSSVGIHIDVRHIAPSPIGAEARVLAEIKEIAGSQVTFSIQAWDEVEKIGTGSHRRVIIDEERFLSRVAEKG